MKESCNFPRCFALVTNRLLPPHHPSIVAFSRSVLAFLTGILCCGWVVSELLHCHWPGLHMEIAPRGSICLAVCLCIGALCLCAHIPSCFVWQNCSTIFPHNWSNIVVSWKLGDGGRPNPVKALLTALCLNEMEREAHLRDDSCPVLSPSTLTSALQQYYGHYQSSLATFFYLVFLKFSWLFMYIIDCNSGHQNYKWAFMEYVYKYMEYVCVKVQITQTSLVLSMI